MRLNHPAIEWQTSAEDPDATTHRGQGAVRRYIDGVYFDRAEALEAVGLSE